MKTFGQLCSAKTLKTHQLRCNDNHRAQTQADNHNFLVSTYVKSCYEKLCRAWSKTHPDFALPDNMKASR